MSHNLDHVIETEIEAGHVTETEIETEIEADHVTEIEIENHVTDHVIATADADWPKFIISSFCLPILFRRIILQPIKW